MATTDLQITTNAFPGITSDDVQIAIYDQGDGGAEVTSQQFSPPHNQRIWNFPGLPISNYLFRIFQMVGSTSVVRQQMGGDTFVVPNAPTTVTYWPPEQITADTTPGFSSGVNTVVFDGTGGKEDWRGRDIGTLVRMGGAGVLKKGVDYSWNSSTGQLTLLVTDDVFGAGEWFNVSFVLQVGSAPASVPTILPAFLTPKVITANYAINVGTDFGGVLIIRPTGNYLEVTFPDIATVPVNKRLKIEFDPPPISGGNFVQQCAKMIFQAGQVLTWRKGNRPDFYLCNTDQIYFYAFIDTDSVKRWRTDQPYGQWDHVGDEYVNEDAVANVINRVLMDGGTLNGTSTNGLDTKQFARHYNDFVLNLPPAEVCDYDAWATGTNKYLYSRANSSNPANLGKYRIPNKLNTFERVTDGTRLPGNQQAPAILQHIHNNGVADDSPPHPFSMSVYGKTGADMPGGATGQPDIVGGGVSQQGLTGPTGGSENRPTNIAVRKYLQV